MNRIKMLWAVLRSSLALACLLAGAPSASAETLLMPERDFLASTSEVVWGVTTQANGTAFTIDYGDGSTSAGADCGADTVADRSYIACNHTYAFAGTFTVKLTVGAEEATVLVRVFNAAALTAFELRGVNTNRAIQDALRSQWVTQSGRAAGFPASPTTSWSGVKYATAFAVLAFENHGYLLANDGSAPTGIYQKYAVQRGLYYIASQLSQLSLTAQTAGSPCVGAGIEAAPCIGLYDTFDPGYSTAVSALPFAGSTALSRTFPAGLGGVSGVYITGKTFREVLQRIMNAVAFGQGESGLGRGGWTYQFNSSPVDGSTVGWDVLALLDATASGIVIPAFVKSELKDFGIPNNLNTNGSFDYQADGSAAGLSNVNFQKGGIGLQALFYVGQEGTGNPQVAAGVKYLSDRWLAAGAGDVTFWNCGSPVSHNKGCAYGMFNTFKALKLHGVSTLAGVTRGAGPGPIPAGDWYADYVDWFLANQTLPTTTTGGHWAALGFSCCNSDQNMRTATALLILSPVALISPDPVKFGTVGLRHGVPLTTDPITNPIKTPHKVTAVVESTTGDPIPGATVNFSVLTGPNAGESGSGVTGADGRTTFTYTDAAGPGTDEIQASLGALKSNILKKIWIVSSTKCDVEPDGDVDMADLAAIRAAAGTTVPAGVDDPRDGNGNGRINVADVRYCQLRLTPVAAGPNGL